MPKKPEKPQLNISVMCGRFYWVRPYQGDEFEPAKCYTSVQVLIDVWGDGSDYAIGFFDYTINKWEVPNFSIDGSMRWKYII